MKYLAMAPTPVKESRWVLGLRQAVGPDASEPSSQREGALGGGGGGGVETIGMT